MSLAGGKYEKEKEKTGVIAKKFKRENERSG
jgi:hypothetical protein